MKTSQAQLATDIKSKIIDFFQQKLDQEKKDAEKSQLKLSGSNAIQAISFGEADVLACSLRNINNISTLLGTIVSFDVDESLLETILKAEIEGCTERVMRTRFLNANTSTLLEVQSLCWYIDQCKYALQKIDYIKAK